MLTEPPLRLEGIAVNVTDVPAHIVPDGDALILTAGVTLVFTIIVIVFDVVVVEVKQTPLVIVISQVTTSLLTSEVVV